MTTIDYAAQFKLITMDDADAMTTEWRRHRVYVDPKNAYESAARSEARGVDVAFATTGYGQYHVWTGLIDGYVDLSPTDDAARVALALQQGYDLLHTEGA
jgi:hypothetical protein